MGTGGAADEPAPTLHAARAGLRLGTTALSGRVSLVASVPGLRWRIVGVTSWRRASTRVLLEDWDTTEVPDGVYSVELERGSVRARRVSVRNYTPLALSPLANASAGLDVRSTDARAVVAAFAHRSYRPGERAVLELAGSYPAVRVEVLHVGPERQLTIGNERMEGISVGPPRRVVAPRRAIQMRIGNWESGLYAARLISARKIGFAPFVVRPRRLGEHEVAVVQPTHTWQSYNYRCADGDGIPDTWYYTTRCGRVDVSRPYLDRGVPPHFRQYDVTFLRWLSRTGKRVDMLAQEDIERISGERLARLYRLIVFPGHHEYATTAEYDAVQRYRDLGGNLAFLSANNYFYRVDRAGDYIIRIGRWRDLGRPEAALVGVQYFAWNLGRYRSRPFEIVGASRAPWLFAGTGLRNGDDLGWFGIEVDRRSAASPRSTRVLGVIPDAFGTGLTAEMTYYETPRGARVFAAGGFSLASPQLRRAELSRLLENIWRRLANEPAATAHGYDVVPR